MCSTDQGDFPEYIQKKRKKLKKSIVCIICKYLINAHFFLYVNIQ